MPPPHTLARPGTGWSGTRTGAAPFWQVLRLRKRYRRWSERVRRIGCDRVSVYRDLARAIGFAFERDTDASQWLMPFTYRHLPVLSLHAQEFEFAHEQPAHVHFVGPMVLASRHDQPQGAADHDRLEAILARRRDAGQDGRLIYAGFGSVLSTDLAFLRRLLRIVEARAGCSAFDVDKALIRSREDDRALYDTAWTLSVLRGLLAALAMWTVAPWVADARMAAGLWVLAVGPILNGRRNPRFVTFERDLVYSKLALLTITAKVVSVTAMLVVAATCRSYWALVLGQLAYAPVGTVLSYLLQPYRPAIFLARVSTLAAFSGWITLASIVTALSTETDKFIVGWLVGVTDAGLYFMTQRVGVLPTQEMLSPLLRLLFPAFSGLGDDAAEFVPPRARPAVGAHCPAARRAGAPPSACAPRCP